MTKFERMNNNMLGNITVGIVIVLAVAACGLGVWLDRAKSDSQDNNTDAQPKYYMIKAVTSDYVLI